MESNIDLGFGMDSDTCLDKGTMEDIGGDNRSSNKFSSLFSFIELSLKIRCGEDSCSLKEASIEAGFLLRRMITIKPCKKS